MKIMFVCHGNICRSPMAEFIMRKMLTDSGLSNEIYVCSRATSREELGNPVYPPAKCELARHNLSCDGKYAVQVQKSDYENYDMFICMDENNIRNIMRIFGTDPQNKVSKLNKSDVYDPWFSGDFETAYNDIYKGCESLINKIRGL